MQSGGAGQESGDLREDGSGWQVADDSPPKSGAALSNELGLHAPKCSRFQLSVRFLVFLVILEAAALVLQHTRSFEFMEQLQLVEHIPWFAGQRPDLAINVTGRALDHIRPRSPIGASAVVHPDTVAADKSHGAAGPTKNRGTLGAPFNGCVFLMSPVSFGNWTPAYRAAFVQWHADFLIRSLGAQTDTRFTALVGPGFSPPEMAMLASRLRPENLVVVTDSVGATAARLVEASSCSWVVSVGIDGDDAVAPFFVQVLPTVQGYLTYKKMHPLGPYRRHICRILGGCLRGGRFLVGEVPL